MPKQTPIRLEQQDYRKLREHVLRRDGWRCQVCGSLSNLEVHHKELRSQCGDDSDQNLITLCVACHSLVHGGQVQTLEQSRTRSENTLVVRIELLPQSL